MIDIILAAAINYLVGKLGDFTIIMAVVVIDVVIGFIQEHQAHKTYAALKSLLKPTTAVMRDGVRKEIEVYELVPSDTVVLNAGERVPGDGEVVECTKLAIEEAILTGESEPVMKGLAPELNKVFMGTIAVTGRSLMRVTATGSRTELGRITTSMQEGNEEPTPLKMRLNAFSKTLTLIVSLVTVGLLIDITVILVIACGGSRKGTAWSRSSWRLASFLVYMVNVKRERPAEGPARVPRPEAAGATVRA